MKGIKNIQYQTQIKQIFILIVQSGKFAGTYEIQEPDGWDSINIVVDINEEFFNVDNFILGETSKMKILEYYDKDTFNLIKNVYEEQGGDGQIIFKWIAVNNGQETDILGDNFEINLNRYRMEYEQSGRAIELEVKKREANNKFLTREDTTINLFSEKNIDENPIQPIKTSNMVLKAEEENLQAKWAMWHGYKKDQNWLEPLIVKRTSSGGFPPEWQRPILNEENIIQSASSPFLPLFSIVEDETKLLGYSQHIGGNFEAHEHHNFHSGDVFGNYKSITRYINYVRNENFFIAQNNIPNATLSFSNFNFKSIKGVRARKTLVGYKTYPFRLDIYMQKPNEAGQIINVAISEGIEGFYHEINFKNKMISLGDLPIGTRIYLSFFLYEPIDDAEIRILDTGAAITLSSRIEKLGRKSRVVSLFDAIDKVAENYTDGQIRLSSEILSQGGKFENQYVGTGLFLRGVANTLLGEEKINTSFKSLFYDGASPLLALGYDVLDNKLIVEDLDYFFKDQVCYNLTDKKFIQDNFSIENDKDVTFNSMIFGTKKYSTKKDGDIKNFNTKVEYATPIKSMKNKLDKTTEFIIDEYKIQDLLDDNSDKTSDNDDDLVLIDAVKGSFLDVGIFPNITHQNIGGLLVLSAPEDGWDTLPLKVGDKIRITEGLNIGEHIILAKKTTSLTLNKFIGVETGIALTKIEYNSENVIKNRNATLSDGFIKAEKIPNKSTAVNLLHNPKFQMKRWFPYFGGGLSKKSDSENIVVTSYKNNGNVELEIDTNIIKNAEAEAGKLNENVSLYSLRRKQRTYFNGQSIEITLRDVSFDEFFNLYNRWRFGVDIHSGQTLPNRGYINVSANGQTLSIYPFGAGAFEFDKSANELTIKGKISNAHGRIKIFDRTFDNTFE